MSNPKVFIVLLFLVGIVFVVGVNLGMAHSDDQTFHTPAWVSGLGNMLVRQQSLKIGDLSTTHTSCIQQNRFVVSVGTDCTFTIQQSIFTQRVISLQLVQGTSAMVTLTQEGTLPLQQILAGAGSSTNTVLKIYSGKAQGVLNITCLNATDAPVCLLKLN